MSASYIDQLAPNLREQVASQQFDNDATYVREVHAKRQSSDHTPTNPGTVAGLPAGQLDNITKANEATAVSVRALNSWVVFL